MDASIGGTVELMALRVGAEPRHGEREAEVSAGGLSLLFSSCYRLALETNMRTSPAAAPV